MAADTLQETDGRVLAICDAVPKNSRKCPWTGARTLKSALAEVLRSEERVKSFAALVIHRNSTLSQIMYGRPNDSLGSVFQVKLPDSEKRTAFRIDARAGQPVIAQLSEALLEALRGTHEIR
jgi:hypothetical protein